MEDVSGFGFIMTVVASNTFPAGFQVSQFADDGDPFDVPNLVVKDKAMGLNGDLIVWSKASPINIEIAVIAGSVDDQNLSALHEANRVGRGKISSNDVVTLTGIYPSGNTITLTPGTITEGMPGGSVASAGRLKTKKYSFTFENRVGLGS